MTLAAEPVPAAAPRASDADLLAAVARDGDRAAHGELVRRYVDFVYAAAVRRLGDRHAAEDVTQAVFLLLAKKAGGVRARALPTWLHRATVYTAANAARAARRRGFHERQAARAERVMPEAPDDTATLRPLLDAAIDSLGGRDRQAVVERYLLGRDFAAIGPAIGLSANAAQKRVERAIEKLRRHFARAGVPTGTAAVTAILAAAAPSPASAAPPLIAAAIAESVSAGTAAPASAVLTHGVLAMTIGTKLKLAAAAVALLMACGAGVVMLRPSFPPSGPPPGSATVSSVAAMPKPQPGHLLATLGDGTVIEVGAIGDHERNEWWTPDGRPAERPIVDPVGRRVQSALSGKRWLWMTWRIERPGTPVQYAIAHMTPPIASSGVSSYVDAQGRPWKANLVAVDAAQTTLTWRVVTVSKPAKEVTLDRPTGGVWPADASVTRIVPNLGRVSIWNPREQKIGDRPTDIGTAFDYFVPQVGGDWSTRPTLTDAAGRSDWDMKFPDAPGDRETAAANVPLRDVTRLTLTSVHWDEWAEFHDLPSRPGPVTAPQRIKTHEPRAAVAAGSKLAPFTDLRFVGDVPQVLVNDVWWEWITLDGRPIADVVADAKRLDERQWRKRLGEDLVDVMTAGGFTAGPTVSLGLRSLDGTSTTTGETPMTADNRRRVRERRAEREQAAEGQRR